MRHSVQGAREHDRAEISGVSRNDSPAWPSDGAISVTCGITQIKRASLGTSVQQDGLTLGFPRLSKRLQPALGARQGGAKVLGLFRQGAVYPAPQSIRNGAPAEPLGGRRPRAGKDGIAARHISRPCLFRIRPGEAGRVPGLGSDAIRQRASMVSRFPAKTRTHSPSFSADSNRSAHMIGPAFSS